MKPAEVRRYPELIESVRDGVAKMDAHQHPKSGDLFCLNLSSWLGERGRYLLAHIDALEAEIAELRKALQAREQLALRLADHIGGEVSVLPEDG